MESEMATAVAKELYERAAELRDAINQLKAAEARADVRHSAAQTSSRFEKLSS
jgi:uncharacterized small protein (DUF1192 family)